MQGLLRKLEGIDSSIERALRIVEFFDQLVSHRADVEAVVRSTAILLECNAGASDDLSGETIVIGSDGTSRPAHHSADAVIEPVKVDDKQVGLAWISRGTTEPQEWDELVVVRMALALSSLRNAPTDAMDVSGLSDPAVIHVLLQEGISEAEASRAARLAGFAPGQRVHVLALNSTDRRECAEYQTQLEAQSAPRIAAATIGEGLTAIVVAEHDSEPTLNLRQGTSAAVGPVRPIERCAGSWNAARNTLRFAALGGTWNAMLQSTEVGSMLALVELDQAVVASLSDVRAVAQIAANDPADIRLLDHVTNSTSLREAAAALFLHHSSVAYRLGRLSNQLGFDLRAPENKLRTRLALILWQLHVKQRGSEGESSAT